MLNIGARDRNWWPVEAARWDPGDDVGAEKPLVSVPFDDCGLSVLAGPGDALDVARRVRAMFMGGTNNIGAVKANPIISDDGESEWMPCKMERLHREEVPAP